MNKQFHYYTQTETPKETGQVNYAGIIVGDTLQIGAAVCGRKEQFVHKRGRLISLARAEKKPIMVLKDVPKDMKELNKLFIDNVIKIEPIVPYGTGDKMTFRNKLIPESIPEARL